MQIFRSPHLTRWLCVSLIGLHLNLLSHSAWADAVTDSAAQAQQLGRQVLQAFLRGGLWQPVELQSSLPP
ncbi:hypothetical protein [Azotobacter vinelandii]